MIVSIDPDEMMLCISEAMVQGKIKGEVSFVTNMVIYDADHEDAYSAYSVWHNNRIMQW